MCIRIMLKLGIDFWSKIFCQKRGSSSWKHWIPCYVIRNFQMWSWLDWFGSLLLLIDLLLFFLVLLLFEVLLLLLLLLVLWRIELLSYWLVLLVVLSDWFITSVCELWNLLCTFSEMLSLSSWWTWAVASLCSSTIISLFLS